MLLLKSEFKITLQRTQPKIMKISKALNNTYVYIATCKSDQFQEKLVHIDQRGKILWQKAYKEAINTFAMFNQRDVIVLNVFENTIDIIDLSTYRARTHIHQFTFDDASNMQLYAFYDTKFLCVQETGNIGDGKMILTYYRYGSNQFEMICEYKSQEGKWNYGQNIAKANNHSKIVWWNRDYTEEIDFNSFDLKTDPDGALKTVKCRNTLPMLYQLQKVTVCIGSLWQSTPEVYMLNCSLNTNDQHLGAFRKNFVIDSVSQIIRQTRFVLENPNTAEFSIFDELNLGAFSVLFSQVMSQGKAMDSLIYYIDNEQQRVITTQTWKATNKSHHYAPGSDPNQVILAEHENSNVTAINFVSKRLMTISEIYLHFLLHINEDFDDDLLQDALQVMGLI